MIESIIKYKQSATIIAIILLVLAIPAGLPYGYYVFLRWIITACSVLLLLIAHKSGQIKWSACLVVIAVLFNPIIPIHLTKDIWIGINALVAFLLFLSFLNGLELYIPFKPIKTNSVLLFFAILSVLFIGLVVALEISTNFPMMKSLLKL